MSDSSKLTDEDLPINYNFTNYNSEGQMEKFFCEWIQQSTDYSLVGRQLPTITGRLDVLALGIAPEDQTVVNIKVFELKNRRIKKKDVDQLLRYIRELKKKIEDSLPMNSYINYLTDTINGAVVGTDVSPKVESYLKTAPKGTSIDIILTNRGAMDFGYYTSSELVDHKEGSKKLEYIDYLIDNLDYPIQSQFIMTKDYVLKDVKYLREKFGVIWTQPDNQESEVDKDE